LQLLYLKLTTTFISNLDQPRIVAGGRGARLQNPNGKTAGNLSLLKIAFENASEEQKEYLQIIQKRITEGNQ
jgi:hypothetical protein